jgi:hypothetical protein
VVELAGVDASGQVWWSEMVLASLRENRRLRSNEGPFLAATLVASGKLLAVRPTGVVRAGVSSRYLSVSWTTPAELSDAIACYYSATTKTLLIVCSNGDLVQVPIPD